MNEQTASSKIAGEITALLRARSPLLWVVTREEARAERYIAEACAAAGYVTKFWDVAAGVTELGGRVIAANMSDPDSVLQAIGSNVAGEPSGNRDLTGGRLAWVLRDLPPWLQGPGGVATLRRIRNLARAIPGTPLAEAQAVVILSPSAEVPAELASHATVIDWPLPDRTEISEILDAAIESLPEEIKATAAKGSKDDAIGAAIGLSGEEAAACFAKSLVQTRAIDPALVSREKKRVIARERVLEWNDPLPAGLDGVGGLQNLKRWLQARVRAYSPEARAYGLPAPRGALLVGVPGCGKTLTAKAVATAWGVPLLRLDINALRSKFVGESESNLRKALGVIEAIGRCVVWIDEIEKAMQGATSGSADGGVAADALGTILSWMQERSGEAFVIATANDVSTLPPELLRKGRFDEVWWIDLPTDEERESILEASLRAFGRDAKALGIDCKAIVKASLGFTGSEIAAVIPDAMFAAFGEDREISTPDLLAACKSVTPLSRTADGKIQRLREWANGRARCATEATKAESNTAAKLDL